MGIHFSKAKARDGSKSPKQSDVSWTQVLRYPGRTPKVIANGGQAGEVFAPMVPVDGLNASPTKLTPRDDDENFFGDSNGVNAHTTRKTEVRSKKEKGHKDVAGALAQAFYLPEKRKRIEKAMDTANGVNADGSDLPPFTSPINSPLEGTSPVHYMLSKVRSNGTPKEEKEEVVVERTTAAAILGDERMSSTRKASKSLRLFKGDEKERKEERKTRKHSTHADDDRALPVVAEHDHSDSAHHAETRPAREEARDVKEVKEATLTRDGSERQGRPPSERKTSIHRLIKKEAVEREVDVVEERTPTRSSSVRRKPSVADFISRPTSVVLDSQEYILEDLHQDKPCGHRTQAHSVISPTKAKVAAQQEEEEEECHSRDGISSPHSEHSPEEEDEESEKDEISSAVYIPHTTPSRSPILSPSTSPRLTKIKGSQIDLNAVDDSLKTQIRESIIPRQQAEVADEISVAPTPARGKSTPYTPHTLTEDESHGQYSTGSFSSVYSSSVTSDAETDDYTTDAGARTSLDTVFGIGDLPDHAAHRTPTQKARKLPSEAASRDSIDGRITHHHHHHHRHHHKHRHEEPSSTDPVMPVGAVELKPYNHQVGGHNALFRFSRRAVCKSLSNRENEFYETIEKWHPDLLQFLPK